MRRASWFGLALFASLASLILVQWYWPKNEPVGQDLLETIDLSNIKAIQVLGTYGAELSEQADGRWLLAGQLPVDRQVLAQALAEFGKLTERERFGQPIEITSGASLPTNQVHSLLLKDKSEQRLALRFALGDNADELYLYLANDLYRAHGIDGKRWLRSPLQWRDKHLLPDLPDTITALAWSGSNGDVVGVEQLEELWQFVPESQVRLPSRYMVPARVAIQTWLKGMSTVSFQAIEATLDTSRYEKRQFTWSGSGNSHGCMLLLLPSTDDATPQGWAQSCNQPGNWYGVAVDQLMALLPSLTSLADQHLLESFSLQQLQGITIDNGHEIIGLERDSLGRWQPVSGSSPPEHLALIQDNIDQWLWGLQQLQGERWQADIDGHQLQQAAPSQQIVLHFQDGTTRYLEFWPKDEGVIQVASSDNHHLYDCSSKWLAALLPTWQQFQTQYGTDHMVKDLDIVPINTILQPKLGPAAPPSPDAAEQGAGDGQSLVHSPNVLQGFKQQLVNEQQE